MKRKTFLFETARFNEMPFGYSANQAKMLIYADVVIDGLTIIKHREGRFGTVTEEQLLVMKQAWNGAAVTVPSL